MSSLESYVIGPHKPAPPRPARNPSRKPSNVAVNDLISGLDSLVLNEIIYDDVAPPECESLPGCEIPSPVSDASTSSAPHSPVSDSSICSTPTSAKAFRTILPRFSANTIALAEALEAQVDRELAAEAAAERGPKTPPKDILCTNDSIHRRASPQQTNVGLAGFSVAAKSERKTALQGREDAPVATVVDLVTPRGDIEDLVTRVGAESGKAKLDLWRALHKSVTRRKPVSGAAPEDASTETEASRPTTMYISVRTDQKDPDSRLWTLIWPSRDDEGTFVSCLSYEQPGIPVALDVKDLSHDLVELARLPRQQLLGVCSLAYDIHPAYVPRASGNGKTDAPLMIQSQKWVANVLAAAAAQGLLSEHAVKAAVGKANIASGYHVLRHMSSTMDLSVAVTGRA